MRGSGTPDARCNGFVYGEHFRFASGFGSCITARDDTDTTEKCLEAAGEEGELVCTVEEEGIALCVCDLLLSVPTMV